MILYEKGQQQLKAKAAVKCLSEEQLVEKIRTRAYEVYEKRGRIVGNETADWLEAEKLVKTQLYKDNR